MPVYKAADIRYGRSNVEIANKSRQPMGRFLTLPERYLQLFSILSKIKI